MAAARRLDDAYRQYLGERGAKRMSLPVISRLVTGNARMRLTAVTLEGLPDLARPGAPAPPPEIAVARAGVSSECAAVRSWFDRFTASLGTGSPAVPPIPPVDDRLAPGLADAWAAARSKGGAKTSSPYSGSCGSRSGWPISAGSRSIWPER